MRDGEDLSAEMGLDVRKLLEEAMKRIDEVDILRVLKKSLYLRLRLCFFLPPRFPGTRSPSPMDNALYSDGMLLRIRIIDRYSGMSFVHGYFFKMQQYTRQSKDILKREL